MNNNLQSSHPTFIRLHVPDYERFGVIYICTEMNRKQKKIGILHEKTYKLRFQSLSLSYLLYILKYSSTLALGVFHFKIVEADEEGKRDVIPQVRIELNPKTNENIFLLNKLK